MLYSFASEDGIQVEANGFQKRVGPKPEDVGAVSRPLARRSPHAPARRQDARRLESRRSSVNTFSISIRFFNDT